MASRTWTRIGVLFLTACSPFLAQAVDQESVSNTRLPTGRTISPAGDVVSFYGRPVDLEIFENKLFVKDRHHLRAIDPGTMKIIASTRIDGGASLFGIACDDDGKVYVTNAKNQVLVFEFDGQSFSAAGSIELPIDSFPCGIEFSADQSLLFVCLSKKNSVAVVDVDTKKVTEEIAVGVAPFDCKRAGNFLAVSNIGGRRATTGDLTAPSAGTETVVDERGIAKTGTLSIASVAEKKVVREIATGLHPSVIESSGPVAIVCNSNEDSISIVNCKSGDATLVDVKPDPKLAFGSMPSCVMSINENQMAVALAGNNAIAIYQNTDDGQQLMGLVPTGWYPASMAMSEDALFVACIKGFGARSERRPEEKGRNSHDHNGLVQRIKLSDLRDSEKMKSWTSQVEANSLLPQILRNQLLANPSSNVSPKPIPERLGEPSIFKHVIYVIKENRTFDQVFGDYKEARSDPNLCIFPRERTPNHHALADRFGILDNYYCNGVLSADGHSWATEGNVTPYLERAFGGFGRSYTFGDDPITYSSSGFIWDHILAAGLSFRNYGEMDYAKPPDGMKYQEIYKKFVAGEEIEFEKNVGIDRLRKYSCREYPGWNMDIPDVLRMSRFLREFRQFEKDDSLPNFCIVYLPEDHLGAPGITSNAHMADNDLALGQLVEAVSKSKYWKDTVIFVNEDDPQNGFDHIDGHRSICLVISAYSKKGVNHSFYNQTSVLRTMLHVFGLPPMNQQDASAPLMAECFGDVANLEPYSAITPTTRLNESTAEQSSWSPEERKWRQILASVPIERTGMKTEQDEDNLNRFIWHEAKGWKTPYPIEFAGAHSRGLTELGLSLDPDSEED